MCGDRIRAMIINGENTVVTDPDREHCEHALRSLDHLVVIDIFLTETAELADVVLPATAWAETDGVCSNTERRVQRLRKAVEPPGEARPDWWCVSRIARRMGLDGFRVRVGEGGLQRAVLAVADLPGPRLGPHPAR